MLMLTIKQLLRFTNYAIYTTATTLGNFKTTSADVSYLEEAPVVIIITSTKF